MPMCNPVVCSPLQSPAHGFKSGSNFTFTSVVRFRCKSGFVLVGSNFSECQSNGMWNTPPPVCKAVNCPTLPAPPNAAILSANNSFEGTTVHACLEGYLQSGGSAVRQCMANRQWSDAELVCEGNGSLSTL